MKTNIKSILCGAALLSSLTAWAQGADGEKFAVKAYANIGLGSAVSLDSSLDGTSKKSSGNSFGVDFGWTFWQKQNHSFEANIGLGYRASSVKLSLENFDYRYQAPADADMDGDRYIRYYEIDHLSQKSTLGHLDVPIYLSYAYRCNDWLGVHADFGFNLGLKVSSKLSSLTGEGYSYGVYPQYSDLKIEESYLNDFGRSRYTESMGMAPTAKGFSCSVLFGVGAEFRIYGPLAADLSFRYNAGLTNLYDSAYAELGDISSMTAPVTYTVKDGQKVKNATDYLKLSKLSQLTLDVSLIYRF